MLVPKASEISRRWRPESMLTGICFVLQFAIVIAYSCYRMLSEEIVKLTSISSWICRGLLAILQL